MLQTMITEYVKKNIELHPITTFYTVQCKESADLVLQPSVELINVQKTNHHNAKICDI